MQRGTSCPWSPFDNIFPTSMLLSLEPQYSHVRPLAIASLLYPQVTTQVVSASLTEAALQRHNQPVGPSPRPTFAGKEITVNNRYPLMHTRTHTHTHTHTHTLSKVACKTVGTLLHRVGKVESQKPIPLPQTGLPGNACTGVQ